jgi:hypothetical protein
MTSQTDRWIYDLQDALRRCTFKLKIEYDRQQPDAPPNECWAECEHAWHLLEELEDELMARGETPRPRARIPRDLPCGHKLAIIPEHPSGMGKCTTCGAMVDLTDYPPALVRDYLSFYKPAKPKAT